jgi:hypothetical protein
LISKSLMRSFAATAERLVIHAHPHPEVERLELAQVGKYRAVGLQTTLVSGLQ